MNLRHAPTLLLAMALQGAEPEAPQDLLALMNTPIQVSSTRPEFLLKSPSTVTILDRSFISQYHFETLSDLLNTVAGIEVVRTNSSHDVVNARGVLQDHYTAKVLFLIDGVPVWDAVTGSGKTALYRIDPRDVERIEVLRGPASVLYGSNAYTGAINIVLRRTWTTEGEIRVGVGSRGSNESGGRISGAAGDLQYLFCASRQDFEGKTTAFTGEDGITVPLKEDPRIRSGILRLDYRSHSLLLSAFRRTEPQLSGVMRVATGLGREWPEYGHLASYTFTGKMSDLGVQARAAYDRIYRVAYITQDATDNDNYDGYRQSLNLKLNWPISKGLDLEFGGDFERRHSTSETNRTSETPAGIEVESLGMENRSVTERSVFVQGNWSRDSLTVVLGSRYTRNELAGSNLSSRITALYTLSEHQAIKAIAGQSFRAPTLFELYASVPNVVMGNTDLKPERASSIELTYVGAFGATLIQATVYRAWYTDKIQRYAPGGGSGAFTYGNGDTFQADALEAEFKWQAPGGLRGMANLDWLIRTDRGDRIADASPSGHYNFKYPPRYHLKSGLSWHRGGFHVSALASLTGASRGPAERIGSQWTSTIGAGYAHPFGSAHMEHVFSIRNANDRYLIYPNYTRRSINDVPQGDYGRRLTYTLKLNF